MIKKILSLFDKKACEQKKTVQQPDLKKRFLDWVQGAVTAGNAIRRELMGRQLKLQPCYTRQRIHRRRNYLENSGVNPFWYYRNIHQK